MLALGAICAAEAPARSPEIAYDAATGRVTLKLSMDAVADVSAQNVRRDNFAVYDNGVLQKDVTVGIEHEPVALGVLIEMGGRSQQVNRALSMEVPSMIAPLRNVLGPDDTLGVFTYDAGLHTIVDFGAPQDAWQNALRSLSAPRFSESNFYDAASAVLDRMQGLQGARALLAVTTGIDTFSDATLDEVAAKAARMRIPVYTIALGDVVRQSAIHMEEGPLARVDWEALDSALQTLAAESGGRAYEHGSMLSAPAIFDDLIEQLRVRYVISYAAAPFAEGAASRQVEVRLVGLAADDQRAEPRPGAKTGDAAPLVATATYLPAGQAAAAGAQASRSTE
jgi:VWFA-related protein